MQAMQTKKHLVEISMNTIVFKSLKTGKIAETFKIPSETDLYCFVEAGCFDKLLNQGQITTMLDLWYFATE